MGRSAASAPDRPFCRESSIQIPLPLPLPLSGTLRARFSGVRLLRAAAPAEQSVVEASATGRTAGHRRRSQRSRRRPGAVAQRCGRLQSFQQPSSHLEMRLRGGQDACLTLRRKGKCERSLSASPCKASDRRATVASSLARRGSKGASTIWRKRHESTSAHLT